MTKVTINGTFYAKVANEANGEERVATMQITNVDSQPPKIVSFEASKASTETGKVTLTAHATDVDNSILAWQFSTNEDITFSTEGGWNTVDLTGDLTQTKDDITNIGKYYFYVKDRLGVTKEEVEVKAEHFDTVKPTLSPKTSDWTNNDVVVDVTPTALSGLQCEYSLDGGSSWTDYSGTSFTVTQDGDFTNKVVARIKNLVTQSDPVTVKLDKTAPVGLTADNGGSSAFIGFSDNGGSGMCRLSWGNTYNTRGGATTLLLYLNNEQIAWSSSAPSEKLTGSIEFAEDVEAGTPGWYYSTNWAGCTQRIDFTFEDNVGNICKRSTK